MSISVEQQETICVIHLEGEIILSDASELKDLLVRALDSKDEIHLDLNKATELDITAVQPLATLDKMQLE